MQRLLLAATEVLEPLGSAFTARNPHSSRFGRLLSLSFTRRGGGGGGAAAAAGGELRAVGASVTAYLLERSRVAALPRGERCFHIVYQMLAAAERNSLPADVEKASLKLQGRGTTRDYRYLRHGAPLTPAEAEAHAAGLGRTRDALGALHLGTEVLPKLLRIVSAALALGNVTFRPAGDGSGGAGRGAAHRRVRAARA